MWKIIVQPGRSQTTAWGQFYYMLENYGHKHTFRMCNTYCFTIASMVEGTRFSVTLYYIPYHVKF